MSEFRPTDAQVIADRAVIAAGPQQVDPAKPYTIVVPEGACLEVPDLDKYLDAPRRKTGTVGLQTVDDFVQYVKRHQDGEGTTIWVDADDREIVAVLDDHGADPAWGEHRARMGLDLTDEWIHWTAKDGHMLGQIDFAEHVEEGLGDIVVPDGATMLEIAQSLQASTSTQFKSAQRLHSGEVHLEFVEEQTARAGQKGDLSIPKEFVLGIKPFRGEDAYRVIARFRHRIRDGKLALGYKLDRPERVIEDAIRSIAATLREQFGDDCVFLGTPRSK